MLLLVSDRVVLTLQIAVLAAEVALILVDLVIQAGVATKHLRASWMGCLELGVTGSGVVSADLAVQAIFFAVELSLFLAGYVTTIGRGIVLLLASD